MWDYLLVDYNRCIVVFLVGEVDIDRLTVVQFDAPFPGLLGDVVDCCLEFVCG